VSPAEPVDGGIDDTLRLLLRDLAKESAKPTIRRARTGQRSRRPNGTVARMNTAIIPRILVGLSIVYGAVVAIVAVTGSDHVGVVAAVGGIIIGTCWALYAVAVPKRPDAS
jgi:membrane associated rhomboid family serine protease